MPQVGAASVLPNDTISSQTLPQEPHVPFLGSISTLVSTNGTINFLGDRDAFRFVTATSGQYTVQEIQSVGSAITPVVTIWDAEGDWIATGNDGSTTSTVIFTASAGQTYYAIAGTNADRAASGVIPTGQTGAYTLTFTAPTVIAADLSITKTDLPDPVTTDGTLTYKITVSNATGGADVSEIVVRDILPSGFKPTKVETGNVGFRAVKSNNIINFTGGSLNAGQINGWDSV